MTELDSKSPILKPRTLEPVAGTLRMCRPAQAIVDCSPEALIGERHREDQVEFCLVESMQRLEEMGSGFDKVALSGQLFDGSEARWDRCR